MSDCVVCDTALGNTAWACADCVQHGYRPALKPCPICQTVTIAGYRCIRSSCLGHAPPPTDVARAFDFAEARARKGVYVGSPGSVFCMACVRPGSVMSYMTSSPSLNAYECKTCGVHVSYAQSQMPAGTVLTGSLVSRPTAPTPSAIPQGYGRVYQMAPQTNRAECSCPCPVSLFVDPSKLVLGCLTSRGGCGAEWDYQTVQNAAIGTDLPAKYPNATNGVSLSGQALAQTTAPAPVGMQIIKSYNAKGKAAIYKGPTLGWRCEDCESAKPGVSALCSHTMARAHLLFCLGCASEWDDRHLALALSTFAPQALPILKPYARVRLSNGHPLGHKHFLDCSCGSVHFVKSTGYLECRGCSLEWYDADVQAASVGDLLPGTPLRPAPGVISTGSAASSQKFFPTAIGNYFGPPATPPMLFDPFDTPGPEPEPTASGKRCVQCRGEWCEALDQFFGDKAYAEWCQPCRKKSGVK